MIRGRLSLLQRWYLSSLHTFISSHYLHNNLIDNLFNNLSIMLLFHLKSLINLFYYYFNMKGLLADFNPLVVANAVAALIEIDEVSPDPVFTMNRTTLSKVFHIYDSNL